MKYLMLTRAVVVPDAAYTLWLLSRSSSQHFVSDSNYVEKISQNAPNFVPFKS